MNALDCTDIKALLSALIDDRLDERTRHEVERHLADCDACRRVLTEAERLDALVAMTAELGLHEAPALPRGFEDAVLAQTVRPNEPAVVGRVGGAAMWTGWAAAAASIALAAVIWFSDRPGSPPSFEIAHATGSATSDQAQHALEGPQHIAEERAESAPQIAIASPTERYVEADPQPEPATTEGTFASADQLRQATRSGAGSLGYSPILGQPQYLPSPFMARTASFTGLSASVGEPDRSSQGRRAARNIPDISRDEADALYNVSLLLHILADADLGSFADIERIRRVVEADDLLDLIAEVRERVDAEDRPALLAAEAVLVRIVQGPLDREDVRLLRETVAQLDLFEEVGSITQRWDAAYSL